MLDIATLDGVALGVFAVSWIVYNYLVDHSPLHSRTVAAAMNVQRRVWMQRGGQAEERISSTAILQVMMTGMSIFASTAIFVIGGLVAGIGYVPVLHKAFSNVPLFPDAPVETLAIKMALLLALFIYIFFSLGWAVRLAHYSAIMIGTLGGRGDTDPSSKARAEAAALMAERTGYHFNRALRGYFFALALVGWFFGPLILIAATLGVVGILIRREFYSQALLALQSVGKP